MLDKAKLNREELYQGKNDYKSGGILFGWFLAPKINFCLTVDKFGLIQEHKTYKGFNDGKRRLDRVLIKLSKTKNSKLLLY